MSPGSGMLKRTKYSRLRNDSLAAAAAADEGPARMPPAAKVDAGVSTLGGFIPRGTRAGAGPDAPVPSRDPSPLRHSKRPVTLHRIAGLPWRPAMTPLGGPGGGPASAAAAAARGGCCWESGALHHHIKYVGSVEVTRSMRTLDFDARMQVTREAISRLCERTSAKTALKSKRLPHKGLVSVLGPINLQFSGSRIILSVSTDSLTLIAASSLQRIAQHSMQAISFASGGDPDLADFIAYVAKDRADQRACHILECPRGTAAEVIGSIGRAFETRFRQLLCRTPPLLATSTRSVGRIRSPERTATQRRGKEGGGACERRNYYNVIPGKTPPPGGVEDLRRTQGDAAEDRGALKLSSPQDASLYENCSITDQTTAPPADWAVSETSVDQRLSVCESRIQDLIQEELWFHGRLGREEAESMLSCSGDFLVRESSSACGQYVLSGMEGPAVRHLLLVDPHGQVRTRDQVFLSVGHLVRFHMESRTPIVSGSSELCLKQPILQRP